MSSNKVEPDSELQVQIQYALMEKLSSAERRQAKLLELLDECVFECDRDWSLTYVNLAWKRLLKYDLDALIGTDLPSMLLHPEICSSESDLVRAVETGSGSHGAEVELMDATGRAGWRELRLTKNGEGGYIGSLFNIQQHKEMEAKLRDNEERARQLSLVASHTSNMVVITDKHGCIEWVNSSFENSTGYNLVDIIGRRPGEFMQGPDTDVETISRISKAVREAQPFMEEILNYTSTGKAYWVAIDASPVTDSDGRVSHFIAIETDVTKRVEAETAAAESEYNYRSVVDNIREVVLRLHPDGEILFTNQAWSGLVGIPEDNCLGADIFQFIDAGDCERVTAALAEYRDGSREVCRLDVQVLSGSGTCSWVEMTMTPIVSAQRGQLSSIAATLVNVSERVASATALREAKQHAEGLAETRSRFLANISHEIRTPLNAVMGATDILQDTGLSREQQRYTNMIRTSGDALLSILDDVLTFSRFESGTINLEQRQFDLGQCLDETIDIVSEHAIGKGLELVLDVMPGVPPSVLGDKTRLRQVLLNLLANAIKFTERGKIIVRVDSVIKSNDCFDLLFQVQDTGIGIAPGKQGQLFDPFVQSDVSTTREYGGSGLGLAICRQICDVVGGHIALTSEHGSGSIFSVVFPLGIDESQGSQTSPLFNFDAAPEFWVVGHKAALNEALVHQLCSSQLPFREFSSADKLPTIPALGTGLLIVTDLEEVDPCREYIQRVSTPSTSLCLLSMNLLGQDVGVLQPDSNELCLNGPFKQSHIPKALEVFHNQLGIDSMATPKYEVAEPQRRIDLEGRTILVVEDNVQNQAIITQYLIACDCQVLLAENGKEALDVLELHRVDLVLMDIQMPVMDGLTATREIRKSLGGSSNVPIIAVTADAIYGDRERFLDSGMNGYISKPIARQELYREIDSILCSQTNCSYSERKIERLRYVQSIFGK